MNKHLQNILDNIQYNSNLSDVQKNEVLKLLKDADKELEITAFKLDRTEKVKRTTAILLEETIEELEQKRKAVEAQNRELEIEAALERVRSVAMGMQNPAEMVDVCKIISEQLEFLKVKDIRNVQTAVIFESKGTYINYEYYARHNKLLTTEVSYNTHHLQEQFANQMLKGAGEFFSPSLVGQQVKDWYEYQKTTNQFADSFLEDAQTLNYYMFSLGPVALGISTYSPLKEEEINLFKRFRNVFELAYRRFTDIQKAEAQAREAQIEAALERIRSRALAMHNSSEVGDVSDLLFSELEKMAINPTGFSIMVFDREQDKYELWRAKEVAHQGVYETFSIKAMYDKLNQYIPGFTKELESKWNSGSPNFIAELSGEKRISFIGANREMGNYTDDQFEKVSSIYPDPIFWHLIFFKHGWLGLIQNEKLAADILLVIRRFADVFEFAHTRFLDLQKAEVQAREAKIEAALERIRSSSLAMNRSEDLKEVVAAIFQKFKELEFGIDKGAALIMTFSPESKDHTQWITDADQTYPVPFFIPFTEHSIALDQINAREKGLDFYSKIYNQKEKNDYFGYLFQHTEYKRIPKTIQQLILNSRNFGISIAFENSSAIAIPSADGKLVSGDDINILKRFSRVFEQSYTRFLDIQKAEAQAREAQIEAALERVRSRSLAMYASADLSAVVYEMFTELVKLDAQLDRCLILIVNPQTLGITWYLTGKEGLLSNNGFLVQDNPHPSHQAYLDGWRTRRKKWHYLLAGDEKKNWDAFGFTQTGLSQLPDFIKADMAAVEAIHLTISSDDFGCLIASSLSHLSEAHASIVDRFTRVFNQTYTRFLDLKKAEFQTKEAVKASSLDRVRAEIASMRTVNDLQRITPLIWRELNTLGVPFIRCGVFIMNEANEHVQAHLSAPDGHSLAAFDLPFHFNELFIKVVEHWRQGNIFETHWNKQEFMSFMKSMIQQGQVHDPETFQGASAPPESLCLHFVPFKQGMLYAGNTTPLELEELQLVKTLAEAFSIAYARYDDFRQLEEAKNQTEKTLNELKSTQAQLIQSEKMASLGQLIAGIAHEINTPLGAINASINTITDSSQQSINLLPDLVKVLSDNELKLLMELVNRSAINNNSLSSKEEREVRRKITAQLEETGIAEADDFADILVDMGIYDEIENYLPLYKPQTMKTAYHLSMLIKNSQNIKMAVDRASKVVFALKNYAHYGNDQSMVEANIVEGLETVLTLYQNQMKHGITLHKEFEEVPSSLCYPDELNQVWTNLIHNAIQAMESRGELTISVLKNPRGFENLSGLQVRIIDTGKGIPPEIKDRIFDAFFTTKPAGEGSGLGLYIVKQIIDKHKGRIWFESSDGKGTTFFVVLPIE